MDWELSNGIEVNKMRVRLIESGNFASEQEGRSPTTL